MDDYTEGYGEMKTRRSVAMMLAMAMTVGMTPAFAQQSTGVISGTADDEARKPYADYSVQLRDPATGQIAQTTPLTAQGQFAFSNVEAGRRLLVELYNTRENRVVCTEGPYALPANGNSRTNVNIDCGKVPAAQWLLLAGAGAAAAVAVTTQSSSQ